MRKFLTVLPLSVAVFAQMNVAPVPTDPHELVTGTAQTLTTPADRANAMALLERSRQNSDMHMTGGASFSLKVGFTVTGNGEQTGSGEITEDWLSGRSWRYDQRLGSYSEVRIGQYGQIFEKRTGVSPLAVQLVRTALFWPVGGNPAVSTIRSATNQWNGKPVTAILITGNTNVAYPGRHWDETEYVVDNATGLLQIYSRAPGTYAVYSYEKGIQFHGRQLPDRITFYVAGTAVVDAQSITIQDLGAQAAGYFIPDASMQPSMSVGMNARLALSAHDPTNSGVMKQVIVHANLDPQGNVIESELSAAADPALAEAALALVKKTRFQMSQQGAYINVRFMP